MPAWREDLDISTTWYEDKIHSGEVTKFKEIEKTFNIIEYRFDEIDSVITKSEDSDTSTSWAEDAYISTGFSEDVRVTTTWSED